MSELERSTPLAITHRSAPGIKHPGPHVIDRSGPAHIVRTGTDHIEVNIGAISEPAEIAAVVSRIELLLAAGDDTVHIVADSSTPNPDRSAGTRRNRPQAARR
jgi:hypothetical protein